MKCQNCNNEFNIDTRDTDFYKIMKVPEPTWCPDCRLQRRLTFLNHRTLYKRTCDLCQKSIISMYHKHAPFPVYCPKCWWSDKWNPPNLDYDFSKPFFEQIKELDYKTARMSLLGLYNTWANSEYNNMAHQLKNCYLLFNSDYNENCSYGTETERCKDCVDMLMADSCEMSYFDVNCIKCYKTMFSIDCENSQDIWFSRNLSNCNNCFACMNLRNKQYHIFNKQYTKQEYENKLKEYNLGSYKSITDILKQIQEFYSKLPNKFMHGRHNTKVSGDYIYNSKNVHDSFMATGSENCRYCMWLIVENNKDCYDYTQFGENTEKMYECLVCGIGTSNLRFSLGTVTNVVDSQYIQHSHSVINCFGCCGLRNKQYCILNKQYTKEQYEEIVPKIIEHMNTMPYKDKKGRKYGYGEFFPYELSPFAYNETVVQEYFPLTKEQAIKQGYTWKDLEDKDVKPTITQLPDHIKDVQDDITEQIIQCEHKGSCNEQCTKAFRIIPRELNFYKKMNIPLPRLCPNCRHSQRFKLKNPIKIYTRKCDKCKKDVETTYEKEIIYCEDCYKKEVL